MICEIKVQKWISFLHALLLRSPSTDLASTVFNNADISSLPLLAISILLSGIIRALSLRCWALKIIWAEITVKLIGFLSFHVLSFSGGSSAVCVFSTSELFLFFPHCYSFLSGRLLIKYIISRAIVLYKSRVRISIRDELTNFVS